MVEDFLVPIMSPEVELPPTADGKRELENSIRHVHPEITQVYTRRSKSVTTNDSHVAHTPPAAPEI